MKLVEMPNFQMLTSHHQLCVVDDVQWENEGSDSSVSNEGPFPGENKSFRIEIPIYKLRDHKMS